MNQHDDVGASLCEAGRVRTRAVKERQKDGAAWVACAGVENMAVTRTMGGDAPGTLC
jgi:hypothetical protein